MKNRLFLSLIVIVSIIGIIFVLNKPSHDEELYLADTKAGDVNGDGKVSASDYVLIRKYLLKTGSLNSDQKKRADINSDGKVNSSDYVAIRKIILNGGSSSGSSSSGGSNSSSGSGLLYKDVPVVDSKYTYVVADFNVLDYGADSSGNSDSTGAFKKAIAAAAECRNSHKCGGTVYVPKGRYVIKETLGITSYVSLIGELEEGTTNGTILMIKHGAGSTDYKKSAFILEVFASIQNIAFWYPDQKVDGNGNVTAYPPTITFGSGGTDGVTLENLYFVNPYTAMDFASSRENISLQFIRRVYGTPLNAGIISDTNYDTMKLENINFSPKYWLNSGLSNIPSSSNLNKALMNSSRMPSAIILKKVDWYFLANINIDGYFMGIRFEKSSRNTEAVNSGNGAEGELYDSKISDCYYPIYAYYIKHITITDTTLKATGNSARAIHIPDGSLFDCSIYNSNISSNGDYAIYYGATQRAISISNSTISGKIGKPSANAKITLVGDNLSNTGFEGCSIGNYASQNKKEYKKRVVTKPKSKNLIKINANQEEDITNKIKDAINKLKPTGGIVYIPGGTYNVSSNITIPSGVEVRGSVSWMHHRGYNGSTVLQTTYKGDSLFTLQCCTSI